MSKNVLKIGIPKGSLENATIELFAKAGWRITVSSRNYFPAVDDSELYCAMVRAQEMSRYVEMGTLDMGLTGIDWVLENESDVEVVADLVYSKVSTNKARWVLAVPNDSGILSIEDCKNKRISTELVNFTRKYFKERNIPVDIEFSWGATEAKVVEGLVDGIVEVTETGSTIKAHGLKIIHTLLETNTKLIANKKSMQDPWKRSKIRQIALLLQGALNAENMVGLKMNIPKSKLEDIMKILPSITAPTISALHDPEWVSAETVITESIVREIIPRLIAGGADGIIEYPLNKIVCKKDAID
jgi:ATP phosphoribosyltransferase